jgi:outer membrane protein assembly factor BamE (lipoprotein component of BamABCDE complex)
MKIFIIILAIFLTSCKLNKVVNHHGIHNLEAKSQELLINQTNINQIKSLLGPPSSTSYFDEDILIYLERKTSNSKLLKLGKKKLIANNVLLLEVNNRGMLINKKFLNQEDLNKLTFTNKTTKTIADQESFVSRALSGVITKIDDPLGKKRGTLGQ